jgi:hypothetical protein
MDVTMMSENLVNIAYLLANHSVTDAKNIFALLQPEELAALKIFLSDDHKLLEVLLLDETPPIEGNWWW